MFPRKKILIIQALLCFSSICLWQFDANASCVSDLQFTGPESLRPGTVHSSEFVKFYFEIQKTPGLSRFEFRENLVTFAKLWSLSPQDLNFLGPWDQERLNGVFDVHRLDYTIDGQKKPISAQTVLALKTRRLRELGFNQQQREYFLRNGICGIPAAPPALRPPPPPHPPSMTIAKSPGLSMSNSSAFTMHVGTPSYVSPFEGVQITEFDGVNQSQLEQALVNTPKSNFLKIPAMSPLFTAQTNPQIHGVDVGDAATGSHFAHVQLSTLSDPANPNVSYLVDNTEGALPGVQVGHFNLTQVPQAVAETLNSEIHGAQTIEATKATQTSQQASKATGESIQSPAELSHSSGELSQSSQSSSNSSGYVVEGTVYSSKAAYQAGASGQSTW